MNRKDLTDLEVHVGIELPLSASLSPAMPTKGISSSSFLNQKDLEDLEENNFFEVFVVSIVTFPRP